MNDRIPFVDLKTQYLNLKTEIDDAISSVLNSSQFIQGTDVKEFENEFARFCEIEHCVGVGSGHAALEMIFEALELNPGDEVIVPVNSYISTALAPSFAKAKVVFADCDPVRYTISPGEIEKKITPGTKVIAVTHLYGCPAEMDKIMHIAAQHNLHVVEDCAQAHGARYKGKRVGTFGIASAFSFYPGKNLGAYGDGGAVVTNSVQMMDKIRLLAEYGQSKKHVHVQKGHNSRLDTLQASILRVKLKRLEEWNEARTRHALAYNKKLAHLPVGLPCIPEECSHVFHVYCITTDYRDLLLQHLADQKIQANIHYPIPIHQQGAYKECGHVPGDFPVTERLAPRILSLPMYPELTNEQIQRIADSIESFFTYVVPKIR